MDWIPRNVESFGWIAYIKVYILLAISFCMLVFERSTKLFFLQSVNLGYVNTYRHDNKSSLFYFNLIMFPCHLLATSLFIWYFFLRFQTSSLVSGYFLILLILTIFYVLKTTSKLLISKIAGIFHEGSKEIFEKISLEMHCGLLTFVFSLIFVENFHAFKGLVYVFVGIVVFIYLKGWVLSLFKKRKILRRYYYPYILYICALEIAPLVILLKLSAII